MMSHVPGETMSTQSPVTPTPVEHSLKEAEGMRRVRDSRKVLAATPEAEREAIYQAVDALFLGTSDKMAAIEGDDETSKKKRLWLLAQNNAYLQVLKMLKLSKHIDPDYAIQGDEDVVHVD